MKFSIFALSVFTFGSIAHSAPVPTKTVFGGRCQISTPVAPVPEKTVPFQIHAFGPDPDQVIPFAIFQTARPWLVSGFVRDDEGHGYVLMIQIRGGKVMIGARHDIPFQNPPEVGPHAHPNPPDFIEEADPYDFGNAVTAADGATFLLDGGPGGQRPFHIYCEGRVQVKPWNS